MERKEDLTMTNKQMLVAQLRNEQEKNRILRIELEKAKREKNFAERDAFAEMCMFNDESRKVQSHINRYKSEIERLKSHIGFLQSVISHSKDMLDEAVKQAKIDVLNKLKSKTWQGYQIGMYIVSTREIDELMNEIKNEQDTSNDTARG